MQNIFVHINNMFIIYSYEERPQNNETLTSWAYQQINWTKTQWKAYIYIYIKVHVDALSCTEFQTNTHMHDFGKFEEYIYLNFLTAMTFMWG